MRSTLRYSRDEYATGSSDPTLARRERNDCTVRAFAVAACMSYDAAHALFAAHGRKERRSTRHSVTAAVLHAEGFDGAQVLRFDRGNRVLREDPHSRQWGKIDGQFRHVRWSWQIQRPTLAAFIAEHASAGHWLVSTGRHMLAVVDGVVHDWRPSPRCKVALAYRLDV